MSPKLRKTKGQTKYSEEKKRHTETPTLLTPYASQTNLTMAFFCVFISTFLWHWKTEKKINIIFAPIHPFFYTYNVALQSSRKYSTFVTTSCRDRKKKGTTTPTLSIFFVFALKYDKCATNHSKIACAKTSLQISKYKILKFYFTREIHSNPRSDVIRPLSAGGFCVV